MDLKFSFGASNPLPLATEGAGSASAPLSASSTLELRVSLASASDTTTGMASGAAADAVVCEALSGDGVSYARAEKACRDLNAAGLASAVRSALARAGAELPEPLIGSVTGVTLELGGSETAVLIELGLEVTAGADPLALVDETLQARTGIAAGTPIHVG